MTRFEPLLRLDVRHDYYGDGPAPIGLEPDAAALRLAARPDLRLRLSQGCAELFAAEDRSALALLAADGALALSFRLRPRDPALAAMTAAVAEARGALAVIDAAAGADGPLHAGATLGAAELKPLAEDGLIAAADLIRPPLALVRLALDPAARELRPLIRFGSVERFWTYHLIGAAEGAAYRVRDREGALSFEALGPRLMANGRPALSFRSSAPVAERARPAGRFELVSEGPFGPRVVLPVLPCPRPGPGVVDPGGVAASEIFVNLC